ncbi:pyridoxamine 5'-phosphate oxidase family protein [Streptomyces sp. SP17BM10]|uniref:pyridoxamine 5'-phosphate oxidase family protein n=1 Tax=Streptomyces sp. SP17BM10 TaxID=3002530 RepID=UPI002E7AAA16|nr:pyridoxamine 5'-phosphate oxidase family protein [Streptomyces sp. SP17BM10]MEE1786657.1 pyridoxamine 5'-phosphate oxidase family protein [Streptomyces sp. SP17BM10]
MAAHPDADDIARRIVERRHQLGLSEHTLCHRAAMAPSYLRLLMQAGPEFDPDAFVRIATALGTTWPELASGHRPDDPPGRTAPGTRPLLLHLTEPECWELLGTHGVGRIGLSGGPSPDVLPVNYAVDARTIVYRTSPRGAAAPPEGAPVSFQVDHIDDRRGHGWSVLIHGHARRIADPDEERRLAALPGTTPWAGGARPLWVRVRPGEVTGRRIGTG